MEIKLKQYVFLPKSLNMSVGKASSQVAHATFMGLATQIENEDGIVGEWVKNGMCVIVLEVEDTEHLSNVAKYLDQWNIPNHLYIDEGITEVNPMTPTALATGVLTEDQFWMFEQFKLFGLIGDAQDIINNLDS